MSESFEEFRKRILKVDKSRVHKITNSYGVYDGYKYYRKNKPLDKKYILSESQYFSIIRKVNEKLGALLLEGRIVELPCRMGGLEIRKYNVCPTITEDGKLKYNVPLNWNEMLRLWYEDSEALENKTSIKYEVKEIFRTYYNKRNANYNNQSFYQFSLNKDLRRMMSLLIKKGSLDAFLKR